jgi:hypothetical protein
LPNLFVLIMFYFMAYRSPHFDPGDTVAPSFTPVPMARSRYDGWTPERQRQFIMALAVVGSVDAAAKMISISRKSAYNLRSRPEAKSFARAWDIAISAGRARLFDYMMDRAINGVTTIQLKLGGAVEIGHGMDGKLVTAQLTSPLPGENRFKKAKQAPKVT